MNPENERVYPCVGICTTDPDSGYCLGCGRPPADEPLIDVAEQTKKPAAGHGDPDSPDPDDSRTLDPTAP